MKRWYLCAIVGDGLGGNHRDGTNLEHHWLKRVEREVTEGDG